MRKSKCFTDELWSVCTVRYSAVSRNHACYHTILLLLNSVLPLTCSLGLESPPTPVESFSNFKHSAFPPPLARRPPQFSQLPGSVSLYSFSWGVIIYDCDHLMSVCFPIRLCFPGGWGHSACGAPHGCLNVEPLDVGTWRAAE